MHKISILFLFLISNIVYTQNIKIPISITNSEEHFEIVGELGVKLGTTITVEGKIIEGPYKGYEGGPNLLIKTINDSSNQKLIKIPIRPYWGKFGADSLPEINTGKTYRFRVYETGKYVGIPREAYKEANIMIQASGFYFKNELVVISGEEINEIKWKPSDFVNRKALISGISKNIKDTAYIIGSDWSLKLISVKKWEKGELGKDVEVYGEIMETNNENIYFIENEEPKLVHLEDMVNKPVKLRGEARSMNGKWWFNYRGNNVYVEKMNQLPNWSVNNHFRAIEISGILKNIRAKDIDKNEIETHLYFIGDYIIINPSWKPIDRLLITETEDDNK